MKCAMARHKRIDTSPKFLPVVPPDYKSFVVCVINSLLGIPHRSPDCTGGGGKRQDLTPLFAALFAQYPKADLSLDRLARSGLLADVGVSRQVIPGLHRSTRNPDISGQLDGALDIAGESVPHQLAVEFTAALHAFEAPAAAVVDRGSHIAPVGHLAGPFLVIVRTIGEGKLAVTAV